ncbi:hypothetical protein [Flavobacterium sp.]|uniref:hypothetical protein n=1 Tax=Flavobacterium sp. TaxID=239 RepID=UPI004047B0B5
MEKSSIHFENVKPTSQSHNLRLRVFDYVREDLTQFNKSYGNMKPHSEVIEEFKQLIKEKTGRAAQAKAKFLIEGVFLFKKDHTNEDLSLVAKNFGIKFDVVIKELHIHRDEGHYDKTTKEWKPNYHAHLVVENINRKTGKSVKWNKEDLSRIQDYFAEALNMQRGIKSDKKHLSALEYKVKKEEEHLKNIMNEKMAINNKKAFELQGKIFSDYFSKELSLDEKTKYSNFLKEHKLAPEFKKHLKENASKTKSNNTQNKKRLD